MTDNPSEELTKILDAIAVGTDLSLATTGDMEAFDRLEKKLEELPEAIKTWVSAKRVAIDKAAGGDGDGDGDGGDGDGDGDGAGDGNVEKTNDPRERPKAEDFEDELEFAKALVAWDRVLAAEKSPDRYFKAPVREDFFTDDEFNKAKTAYDTLVGAIAKSVFEMKPEGVELTVGEAIKKSLAVRPVTEPEGVDFEKLNKLGEGNMKEYFKIMGLDQ